MRETAREHRARAALIAVCAALVALLAQGSPASAQTIQLSPFGGQTYPTNPYFVTGGAGDASRVYVVEGGGVIRLVKDGVTQPTPFLDISADVLDGGERGLLSMALAPDYASSGLFYVFYTRDDTGAGEHYLRIEEFRRFGGNPDVADPGYRRIVMEIPHLTAGNHNGGQLQFGPDKLLYISTGDGGDTPNEAQSLTTRLGKLLRIDPRGGGPFQYTIPADNPFADGAGPLADEIYAYGLRNPYRFSFDRSTGDLTIGDVGSGSWEEIDFRTEGTGRGVNFGWPCYEGNLLRSSTGVCTPPMANYVGPVHEYANPPAGSAAINGGYVIRDPALPGHAGRYLYADTYEAVPGIRTISLSQGGSSGDASLGIPANNFPVSFGQDACGHLYLAELGTDVVSRLVPAAGPFPCKLAPELTLETGKATKRVKKRGAIVLSASCDEDCDLSGDGEVKIKGRKRPLEADAVSQRLQRGDVVEIALDLSKKETKRLRKALRRGKKAKAMIEVSATGGGGGTDTEERKVKQRR